MKNVEETFKVAVYRYIGRTGISDRALGINALNDSSFVTRLKQGRAPTVSVVDRVLDWMRDNPPKRKRA